MPDAHCNDAELFAEALRLPPAARAAFLDGVCGADAERRRRFDQLLEAQSQLGNFLEQANPDSGFSIAAASLEENHGRVGRYRLIEKLGEGGCGVVYLAEQDEPVRRQVALKIIKPGMDTKEVIARFEAERQALALMDHPGIAKVFDAGQTESGRPYFVMELIRGQKITDFCDNQGLSTEERLRLFVQVCQAIQHAHQKGVIHRDIKPSNILVRTGTDGLTQPVVIDFGIAKATLNVRLTDRSLFTAAEMLVGTPTYMSPEQASGTGVDVDTRSDIYALGTLLYELLTGATPFDAGELLQLGIEEVRRAIREREPLRPSVRLGRMTKEALTTIAQRRKADPPSLVRSTEGDLDWIAMKCLEKDRARRYETANGLALDIQRFLSDEAVSARPASVGYRLGKVVARHKLAFATAATVTLLLLVSLVLISAALAKERRARHEADLARRQAEADKRKAVAEADKSRQVTQFLENLLQGVGPSVALGRDTTMLREILDRTASRLEVELRDQPAAVAHLRNQIGGVYSQLAAFDQAEAILRAALASRRALFGENSREVAETLGILGVVLIKADKRTDAEAVLREAIATNRKVFGDVHPELATNMSRLSSALISDGKDAEAEELTREALAMRRKLFGSDHLMVANSLTTLGVILSNQQKYSEAESIQREALALRRKLLPPGHPQIADAMGNLCWTLSQYESGTPLEAVEALMRETIAMNRTLYGNEHPNVSDALSLYTGVLRRARRLDDAEAAIQEAIVIGRATLSEDHSSILFYRNTLGVILAEKGKFAEAEAILIDTADKRRKSQGNDHLLLALTLADLGDVLFKQQKLPAAESRLREAVAIQRVKTAPKDPVLAATLAALGAVLHASGQDAEAEVLLREATAIEHEAFRESNPLRTRSLDKLLAVLDAQGKAAEAEAVRAELARAHEQATAAAQTRAGAPKR